MSILRQSAIILILGWMLVPLQFVTSALVALAVGPEGKGVLFLLSGLTAVMTSLTTFGLASGAIVLFKQQRRTAGEIIGTALVVTAVSLLLVGIAYALLSDLFVRIFLGNLESVRVEPIWITLALLTVLPTAMLSVGDVLLIADDAMRLYAVRSAGTAGLTLALTWLLAFGFDLGITGVLLSQPLASIFGLGVVMFWMARKGFLREVRFSLAATLDLLRIGVQQYGISLVALVSKRFDGFLIANLLSVRDAGYYSIANQVQGILVNIPRATMWPLVSSLSAGDRGSVHGIARASRVQIVIMLVVTAVALPLADSFVQVVFGSAFAPAADALRWALLGIFATPITICANAYFTARGRPGLSILTALVATGVQVGLNLVMVPRWGVSGSAFALSVSYIVAAAVQLLLMSSQGEIRIRDMLVPSRADLRVAVDAIRAGVARVRSRRARAPGKP